jgi:AhpC/TSA family
MRVCFTAKLARLSALAALLAACSSTPIEDEPSGNTAAGSSGAGTAGSAPATPGEPPITPVGDYRKRTYPAGPYGTGLGATLSDYSFLGWHDPVAANYDETKLEEVSLSEYYDPEGAKGIKVIWINASAVWCSVCRTEMKDIKNNGVRATFGAKGVQMLVTLFEDKNSGPAKPLDLHNWGSAPAHLIDFPLVLDPGFKLGAFFTSDATPLNMLVDARTMKVIDATMGYSLDYWQQVDDYLAKME